MCTLQDLPSLIQDSIKNLLDVPGLVHSYCSCRALRAMWDNEHSAIWERALKALPVSMWAPDPRQWPYRLKPILEHHPHFFFNPPEPSEADQSIVLYEDDPSSPLFTFRPYEVSSPRKRFCKMLTFTERIVSHVLQYHDLFDGTSNAIQDARFTLADGSIFALQQFSPARFHLFNNICSLCRAQQQLSNQISGTGYENLFLETFSINVDGPKTGPYGQLGWGMDAVCEYESDQFHIFLYDDDRAKHNRCEEVDLPLLGSDEHIDAILHSTQDAFDCMASTLGASLAERMDCQGHLRLHLDNLKVRHPYTVTKMEREWLMKLHDDFDLKQ